jgi:hypothetical protein
MPAYTPLQAQADGIARAAAIGLPEVTPHELRGCVEGAAREGIALVVVLHRRRGERPIRNEDGTDCESHTRRGNECLTLRRILRCTTGR